MKAYGIAAAAWATVCGTAWGQNWAEPTYQGSQPSIVQGTEDGMATGKPKVRHVYAAAPDVLAIVIDAQNVWSGPLVKYEKQPGDEIRRARPQHYGTQGRQFFWGRDIYRDGKLLGDVVGLKEDHYSPKYEQRGQPLDLAWADTAASYAISSQDDADFTDPISPTAIYRKSKPETYEWVEDGVQKGSHRHEIFLRLPRPLKPGSTYTIAWRGSSPFGTPLVVTFDDARLRSEAIQVNQVGYHPRQAEKVARLSMWLGSGGGVAFDSMKRFRVVDDASGRVAFEGDITPRRPAVPGKQMPSERTDEPTDDLPMSVYQLDFSAFTEPGVYRIVVPGLGSSFPFRIDQNVWRDAAKVSAHGFLNQRSGMALGPPHTQFTRPRDLHPADGVPIYRTDPAKFFDPAPALAKINPTTQPATRPSIFHRIQASILEDQTEPNAWGGWHDAADYDRDILPQRHLAPVQAMLNLHESNPAFFEKFDLNIPESGNAIPDIVDEALWCTDLWLRLQQPDGGVPGAVESIEHPSEPSWLIGQPTAVTPPTPGACQLWAAASAQMAIVLDQYDAPGAKAYRESALRAMAWADGNAKVPDVVGRGDRPAATLWLYRLTGDQAWHQQFKDSAAEKTPGLTLAQVYALMPEEQTDPALRKRCRDAVMKAADAKAERTGRWTWNLGPQRYDWDERLGSSSELVAAHRLTGDAKYVRAIERQAQFALGMNPTNASYTSGLGTRQVVPFNLEARYLGSAFPHGITTYGPAPRNIWRGTALDKLLGAASLYPEWKHWPWAESSFNLRTANINEYTVGSMGNILMTRAYLAQHFATMRP